MVKTTIWSRRDFVSRASLGCAGALGFMITGCRQKPAPVDARAGDARAAEPHLRTLSLREARTLGALGEVLVPGSGAAGLVQYIDRQLSGPPADSMLMIRYLGVRAPFTDFYRRGLEALDSMARARQADSFGDLPLGTARALIADIAAGDAAGWSGPPAGLFYFVLRSDAVDVVYGTPAGFAKLGVPYMAHIAPPAGWGA